MARTKNTPASQPEEGAPLAEQIAQAAHDPIDEMTGEGEALVISGTEPLLTEAAPAPQPTSASDSAVQLRLNTSPAFMGEMLSRVSVRVMPPLTHRRRAGMGFGQQAQTLSVSAEVLDALVNDPLLIVEEA